MELEEIQRKAEEFLAKLDELNSDAHEVVENGETTIQVSSPVELGDQAITYLMERCPYTLKFITAPKFRTGVVLNLIAQRLHLEMKLFRHEDEPHSLLLDLKGGVAEETMSMLMASVIALLVGDGYAKTLTVVLNDEPVAENLNLEEIGKTIGQIVDRIAGEHKAASESEQNQAKGTGITDEAVAKLTQVKTVEDILRL